MIAVLFEGSEYSLGFVISQDGDVRAMTQVRGKLVVWENLRLQRHDVIHRTNGAKRK